MSRVLPTIAILGLVLCGSGELSISTALDDHFVTADQYSGKDWADKLNTAQAHCNEKPCDIYVPSSLAGNAGTTWTPKSNIRYNFAPGTFSSSACPMIKIPEATHDLTIQGAGARTTRFVTSTRQCDVFRFDGTAVHNINDVDISGISVESSVSRTSGDYFHLRYVQPQFSMHDFSLVQPFVGIDIDEGSGTVFLNRIFINGTRPSGRGLWIRSTGCCFYLDILVANSGDDKSTATGIQWDKGDDFRANDVDIVKYQHGIKIAPLEGTRVHIGFLTNVSVDSSSGDGISVGGTGGLVEHLSFIGSWASTSRNHGNGVVFGTGTRDATWIGGNVLNNAANGIVVDTAGHIRISDATISGNSVALPYSFDGIKITSSARDFIISENRIGLTASEGDTQGYAVSAEQRSIMKSHMVGNNLRGNHCGTIVLLSPALHDPKSKNDETSPAVRRAGCSVVR